MFSVADKDIRTSALQERSKLSDDNSFSKCELIWKKLRIFLHLKKKFLMKNLIFVSWNFWRVF